MSTASLPREERRRRSESAILEAARELFAEGGFEQVTIRAVASRAGIDPALVMQHFGSKEGLFVAAARWPAEHETATAASMEQLPAAALADLVGRFEGEDRESAIALMRNCLTHPSAEALMRDEVMRTWAEGVAATVGGDDADLRAGLVAACLMGLGMARYLLELPAVASASHEDLERLMTPVLRSLVGLPVDETA